MSRPRHQLFLDSEALISTDVNTIFINAAVQDQDASVTEQDNALSVIPSALQKTSVSPFSSLRKFY
jgi:hypothetical protein